MTPQPPLPNPRKPPSPAPQRPGRLARVSRLLLWALPALGIGFVLLVAALAWLTRTEDGAAWLFKRVPGLTVVQPRGSLWRTFEADRIDYALPGGAAQDRVVLHNVHWEGMRLQRPTHAPHWLLLHVTALRIERVDIERAPAPDTPRQASRPPASLALPIEIEAPDVRIGALHAAALGSMPLRHLRAQLRLGVLGENGRDVHRIDGLALDYGKVAARGALRVASGAPFDVAAELALAPSAAASAPFGPIEDFHADIRARGPLDWLNVTAALRGRLAAGSAAAEPPALEVKAALLPFAAWPIGALEASTRGLDLSALSSALPSTALTGTATLASDAAAKPASLAVALDNARAGRVDEGLLPLRSLRVDVRARPDAPEHIELHDIDAQLGGAQRPAGHVQGSGSWSDGKATLDLRIADVRPSLLDARAPAMRLGGSAALQAEGLAGTEKQAASPSFRLAGRIDGTLPLGRREQRVQLQLDASGTSRRIELHKATAQAGASRASLSGEAASRDGGGWRVRANGSLANVDPATWWPGRQGSAWRQGPHRLNANIDADLLWQAADTAARTGAASLRGHARADLSDSVLAGVPIAGRIAFANDGTALPGAPAKAARALPQLQATLDVAGARVVASGRIDTGSGAADHWDVDAQGGDLARLAPLLRLAGEARPVLAGRVDLQASVDGRWPELSTRGSATLAQLRVDDVRLAAANARWRLGSAPDAPLEVEAELRELSLRDAGEPTRTLASAQLQLHGSLAEHRLTLDAASPARPPAWLDALRAETPAADKAAANGSALALRAQGALSFDRKGIKPLQWRGNVQRFELRPGGAAPVAPWLAMDEVGLDLSYDRSAAQARIEVAPGRLQLPGAALRWTRLAWQGGARPVLDVQAQLEPVMVAPLLARLQPDFGWRGDLVVAGRVDVRSAPRFEAAIEVVRQQGDLSVSEVANNRLALGLTDLRLALDAKDGVWRFTQAFAGKTLGAMAAAATVRTTADRLWPAADAPLQGVLEASVANLGAWGAWVPAGWRLAGALHASASIGGRFGAPQYTGEVNGSGLGARNLIEGIDLHDGELALRLQGETARIEKLEARAGEGRVALRGGAEFGATPTARLKLVAERAQVLGRVDRRIVVSGEADLLLKADSIRLDGGFKVDEGLIDISRASAPQLGDDVRVIRRGEGGGRDAATAPHAVSASGRQLALDLRLDLGDQLRLRGRGIDTLLRGQLQIGAPGGKLALNGSVHTAEGHYAAYGQQLDIERGVIIFAGAPDNPRLDILALRPDLDVRVGVAIGGTAQSPRVRLFSEPEMADADKLSWLVLGRAPEGLGGDDVALLQRAALGLLAGEGKGPGSGLTQRLGLDDLSLRQSDGEVRETVVSLGKQLTRRWYVGYERSLNATAGSWQLIYRIARRFTLRAQSGIDNSLDVIWTWRWQ